jgi:hypothetical protein
VLRVGATVLADATASATATRAADVAVALIPTINYLCYYCSCPLYLDSVAAADCSRSLPLLMVHGLMCADS